VQFLQVVNLLAAALDLQVQRLDGLVGQEHVALLLLQRCADLQHLLARQLAVGLELLARLLGQRQLLEERRLGRRQLRDGAGFVALGLGEGYLQRGFGVRL
jgi:hypothetical protein